MRILIEIRNRIAVPMLAMCMASILLVGSVWATPTLSIHWNECPFPGSDATNRNAGTGPVETITVTATGLSGPVRAADVRLLFRAEGALPDAWRYDDAGCEAHRATFGPGLPGGSCPPLDGSNPLQIARFTYDPDTGWARLVFARAYEGFVADPNVVYTLGRFTFDHSAPDPCACLEAPVCIQVVYATWVDPDIVEFPEQSFAVEREVLTWNDPNNTTNCPSSDQGPMPGGCIPTATPPVSWGRVKASYR